MNLGLAEAVLAAVASGRTAVMISRLDDARAALIIDGHTEGDLAVDAELRMLSEDAARRGRSALIETAAGPLFLRVFQPPPRLIAIGAVHIAEPLARIAAIVGWRVTVVDPRRAWAQRPAFAHCTIVAEWPDAALAALAPDRNTAIVTLTHDPKLDDPALMAALASPAFYVGALGSRRTHAKRLARLAAAGVDNAALGRIHAPVGLAIGALTPAEIALAIVAEITKVRRADGGGEG